MKNAGNDLHIYDANTVETRTKSGLIPGAIPLQTVSQFGPAQTLPKNKDAKLVFYCANTECIASHQAAQKAVEAGYTNVSVMADGIQDWKKAGKPTAKLGNKS